MVAPRAGAWIEASPAGCSKSPTPVAPRAGAWIEALSAEQIRQMFVSLPVRERGLKRRLVGAQPPGVPVAPRAGAWIEAFHAYYGVFDHLIVSGKGDFVFAGRNRRPPLDPVNCHLSFVYTLLAHDVRSALETTGLDPSVGFLHRDRPGRPGLALDLMTHFRRQKNSAIIVGGDRSDVHLVALEGDSPCLVLTGNLYPNDIILTRSEVLEIPIIVVREDTYTVAKKMETLLMRHKLRDEIKIRQGAQLINANLDFATLKSELGL